MFVCQIERQRALPLPPDGVDGSSHWEVQPVNSNESWELARLLRSLCEIDRMAGCSDLYFRQVCTARINAIRASGFIEKLAADETEREAPRGPEEEV